mmetsp:Transcript_1807/g.3770  ORF Transcript_1807/g.3770 Transcript_1807/m.3770 type:complete len:504 (-) Transcript_1807:99-1610(-)
MVRTRRNMSKSPALQNRSRAKTPDPPAKVDQSKYPEGGAVRSEKQMQRTKSKQRKGRSKSPAKSRKGTTGNSRASSRGRIRSRSRSQARRSKSLDGGGSVGSTLSTQDQFDIILPIDQFKMEMRREKARQGKDDDAVSSLTTDEYRKYGGWYWRLKTGNCSDCCAPLSCSKTVATEITEEITVPPLGANDEELEKHVNFEVTPAEQVQQASNQQQQQNEGAEVEYHMCGGTSETVQDKPAIEQRRVRSRSLSPSRSVSRDRTVRKSDRSVDRSSSLFDDALSEADERELEANRGGRMARGWKLSFPKGPWNRKRNQKSPAHDFNDDTITVEYPSNMRPESRQGRESLAMSSSGRDTPGTMSRNGGRDTPGAMSRNGGRDTPGTVASSVSLNKRKGSRAGAESPVWTSSGGRDTPATVSSTVSRKSIMKRRGSRAGAVSPDHRYSVGGRDTPMTVSSNVSSTRRSNIKRRGSRAGAETPTSPYALQNQKSASPRHSSSVRIRVD